MNNLISEYNSKELLGGMRLFLYEKKIIYLSRYQNGKRENAAGFIKVLREKNAYTLDIHIKSDLKLNGTYTLLLLLKKEEFAWEKIFLTEGRGAVQREIKLQDEMICIGQEVYKESRLLGIKLLLDNQNWISGNFREEIRKASDKKNEENIAVDQIKSKPESNEKKGKEGIEPICFSGCPYVREKEMKNTGLHVAEKELQPVFENKWEQLQHNYQTVHPFDDQRTFLSIEPKDFVILQAPFQKLVNNSFLLHGFYNYRHLILGPDRELGGGGKIKFYLGVPGTYFDREKMVAVMFGFEGFECAGAVEAGKFGYYMRQVEL